MAFSVLRYAGEAAAYRHAATTAARGESPGREGLLRGLVTAVVGP